MRDSNILSKFFMLISLCFVNCSLLSMEVSQELTEEKHLLDILPGEVWSMIADYLPGNNQFLNMDLAHRIRLSIETQKRIIESFVTALDLKSIDIDSSFRRFIYKPYFLNIPEDIKQKYFEVIQAFIQEDFDELNNCITTQDKGIDSKKILDCFKSKAMVKQKCMDNQTCCIGCSVFLLVPLAGLIGIRVVVEAFVFVIKLIYYVSEIICAINVLDRQSLEWHGIGGKLLIETGICLLASLFIYTLCMVFNESKSKQEKIKSIWG